MDVAHVCTNQTFLNGVADTALSASLNFANRNGSGTPSNHPTLAPTISVTLNTLPSAYNTTPYNTSAYNTGTTPTIIVNRGTASRLELHNTSGDNGNFIANQYSVANGAPYWNDAVGIAIPAVGGTPASASRVFYSTLTDSAGNFISNPSDTIWIAGGAFQGEFVSSPPFSPPVGASATYTPALAGAGTILLYSQSANNGAGVTKSYSASTNTADHFEIYLTDGTANPNNTLDVTKSLTLHVVAKDEQNNTIQLTGSFYLDAYVTGANSSLKPTAPIVPVSGTFIFANGVATKTGLRLPNSSDTVRIGLA
jgi:hypothetical protein